MEGSASKFWSLLVITLSEQIINIKKDAFYSMKFLTISSAKKRIERFDAYSSKHSGADQTSYTSISDFKPLNNLYSSVKLYEEDFSNNTYQTKKQIIK